MEIFVEAEKSHRVKVQQAYRFLVEVRGIRQSLATDRSEAENGHQEAFSEAKVALEKKLVEANQANENAASE